MNIFIINHSVENCGVKQLEKKYNSWTNEKFIHILETIIEKTFEV